MAELGFRPIPDSESPPLGPLPDLPKEKVEDLLRLALVEDSST